MYSFAALLTIIFVIAKLVGLFSVSWWIVFSPILIVAALGIIITTVILAIGFAATR